MTYEKRANCLALSFATLILISIISEFAGWQHTVLWRGASTVIMQFSLLAYAILAIRDNKRGGAIIRASVTPSRNIFSILTRLLMGTRTMSSFLPFLIFGIAIV